jgi:hypothetical protein
VYVGGGGEGEQQLQDCENGTLNKLFRSKRYEAGGILERKMLLTAEKFNPRWLE